MVLDKQSWATGLEDKAQTQQSPGALLPPVSSPAPSQPRLLEEPAVLFLSQGSSHSRPTYRVSPREPQQAGSLQRAPRARWVLLLSPAKLSLWAQIALMSPQPQEASMAVPLIQGFPKRRGAGVRQGIAPGLRCPGLSCSHQRTKSPAMQGPLIQRQTMGNQGRCFPGITHRLC